MISGIYSDVIGGVLGLCLAAGTTFRALLAAGEVLIIPAGTTGEVLEVSRVVGTGGGLDIDIEVLLAVEAYFGGVLLLHLVDDLSVLLLDTLCRHILSDLGGQ